MTSAASEDCPTCGHCVMDCCVDVVGVCDRNDLHPEPVPGSAACLPTEQIRTLVNLLYPDHLTPTAKRMFEAACHEVEEPPDEDKQQVAT